MPPNIICVLGMHRSGTSLTAGLLQFLGVYLGPEGLMMGPDAGSNPKGHFEFVPFIQMNDDVLALRGGDWRTPPKDGCGWESSNSLDSLAQRADGLTREHFKDKPLWGFKDPRSCLTVPFWKRVLGPNIKFIIIIRNPLNVALSLQRRDGFPMNVGASLWERYMLTALTDTAECSRIIMSYDAILSDFESSLKRLASFIGASSCDVAGARALVADDLRHYYSSTEDLYRASEIDISVKNLYVQLLEKGQSGKMNLSEKAEVDVLIANWNTLPWLKLNVAQFRKLKAGVTRKLHVWDDGSSDGSLEWLKDSGIAFYQSGIKVGHAAGLKKLIDSTSSEYIALLDVDAIPIAEGWLDEAIGRLQDSKCGAVGFDGGLVKGRKFLHVSFGVFRRKLFQDLALKLDVIYEGGVLFDVGQFMCMQIQDAGYRLEMLGKSQCDPLESGFSSKVYHFAGSTNVMTGDDSNERWHKMQQSSVMKHKKDLTHFGLWDEFRSYVVESASQNKRCNLYL